jgi:hypothetical protein
MVSSGSFKKSEVKIQRNVSTMVQKLSEYLANHEFVLSNERFTDLLDCTFKLLKFDNPNIIVNSVASLFGFALYNQKLQYQRR